MPITTLFALDYAMNHSKVHDFRTDAITAALRAYLQRFAPRKRAIA